MAAKIIGSYKMSLGSSSQKLEPSYPTFSQAYGYEEFPQQLALEELSEEARVKLWDALVLGAWSRYGGSLMWRFRWEATFRMLHSDFLVRPMDQFGDDTRVQYKLYRDLVLNRLPFNKVFDLFQMIMRHPSCPPEFTTRVARVFQQCRLAYVVDTASPATILPATARQEGESIAEALHELRAAGLGGAETHLRRASESVNRGDWAGAVRESIHAVESVARQLDPDASKTLRPALRSLENTGRLHPALKEAFANLYGYASDEKGVRHALLDTPSSPVGQDEAVFMLGACASFASYLWRRHQARSQP